MDDVSHEASLERRRKRRRIAESDRQRSTVACNNCRRLKEKCDGKIPCERCSRHGRSCEVKAAEPRRSSPQARPSPSGDEAERTVHLETVARHFLGDKPLTVEQLRTVVQNLQPQSSEETAPEPVDNDEIALDEERFTVKALSGTTAHYSGELSHWSFSQKVRHHVDTRLHKNSYSDFPVVEFWRPSHLLSREWMSLFNKQSLPPWDVATFLIQIYFDYGQVNDCLVERRWVQEKLCRLYSFDQNLTAEDAPWIAIVLLTMAVGSQFAHMTDKSSQETTTARNDEDEATENAVGIFLFRLGSSLVPDMILMASVESMQAFMLLAHFTLPLDSHGMAYTYNGIALKMAIQNGLHRRYQENGSSDAVVDLRSRLFWTAYKLDTRISILHGRPRTMAAADIDVVFPSQDLPEDLPADIAARSRERIATSLTDWLIDFADSVHMLRRCPKRLRHAYLNRLLQTRARFKRWWFDISKTSDPQLSRSDMHLHLSYHVNLVFMGRPFIFTASQQAESSSTARDELVQDAINSAFKIIDLASILDQSSGLARASYIEFSSIRAALLAMLAESLNKRTQDLRDKIALGMRLISSMAVGILSTRSEASIIGALEAAIRQIDAHSDSASGPEATPQAPDVGPSSGVNYQKWTSLWQEQQPSEDVLQQQSPLPSGAEFLSGFDWSPLDASLFDTDLAGLSSDVPLVGGWSAGHPIFWDNEQLGRTDDVSDVKASTGLASTEAPDA